jgi:1,4-dihydroxy-2-naphthoyl-CoA hydrolase
MVRSLKQTVRLADLRSECQFGYSRHMSSTTHERFQSFGRDYLPGTLGIEIIAVTPERVESRMTVQKRLLAPNGYLHAASVVALADTSCGYGCVAALPEGASGFTTIELKSNFLGTTRDGAILCRATPVHRGRTTHVWDAAVTVEGSGGRIAQFRCTQMILWPK